MSSDKINNEEILQAGGLLGKRQKGSYKIAIFPAKQGEMGAIPVADLLKANFAQEPRLLFRSPLDGQDWDLAVPDGSLKNYIEQRPADFNHLDAHVIVRYEYMPAPGEEPFRVPVDKLPEHIRKAIKEHGQP